MGLLNDGFKEIFFLAKEAMDVQDEGLNHQARAGQLLVYEKFLTDIQSAAKELKTAITEEKKGLGEVLNEMRKHVGLDNFAEQEDEIPKTASIEAQVQPYVNPNQPALPEGTGDIVVEDLQEETQGG